MDHLPTGFREAIADRYRIDREIGAGGMATVHLAEDVRHHRRVAIKVLRPELGASMGADRFHREIAIAANLQHPHILPLYDSGEAAGALFYVMPFVEGQTLREKLARERELPIGEATRLLREIADAVAAAHAKGVVHRDLKPENIMLSGRHALVADFGVAKAVSESTGRNSLTSAGVALGTPSYMAPEQATADPHTDHRADLYALGVIAYEMLTGQPPFVRATPQATLSAQVMEAPRPVTESRATIPPALADIVMRCLAKKPADRPSTADEVLGALEAVGTHSGGATPTAGTTPTGTAPYAATAPAPERSAALPGSPGARRWPGVLAATIVVAVGGAVWTLGPAGSGTALDPMRRAPIVVRPFAVRATDASLTPIGLDVGERFAASLQSAGIGPTTFHRGDAGDADASHRAAIAATDAATVVEGTVSQRGSEVELDARVVRAADGLVIWSLGPERVPISAISDGIARLQERVLGAVGWYTSPLGLGRLNPSVFSPPSSLAQLRHALMAEERALASAPGFATELRAAVALDSAWPWAMLRLAMSATNADEVRNHRVTVAHLGARRGSLTTGEAALLALLEAWSTAPEDELAAVRRLVALEPAFATELLQTLGRARRAREYLRVLASMDTSSYWAPTADLRRVRAATAYHDLGEFDAEAAELRALTAGGSLALAGFTGLARAYGAQGNERAIDSLLTAAAALRNPFQRGFLVDIAGREAAMHGHADLAARLARRTLEIVEGWPDSARSSIGAMNTRRTSHRLLGEREMVVRLYEQDERTRGRNGPAYRLLAMRDRILLGDTVGALALVELSRTNLAESFGAAWTLPGTPEYYGAHILALLGRKDEAVTLLRQALNEGWRLGLDEELQWFWATIRDYPPFVELVRIRDGN
jgi:tRNA A-37 threonylcarbamoyl transferase component Bud32/TolB-like protein